MSDTTVVSIAGQEEKTVVGQEAHKHKLEGAGVESPSKKQKGDEGEEIKVEHEEEEHTGRRGGHTKPKGEPGMNCVKALHDQHHGLSFKEIIKLPVGAFKGIRSEDKFDQMMSNFNVKTIEDLGTFRYYHAARAIEQLAAHETRDHRPAESKMNINGLLHKDYHNYPLKQLQTAPLHVFEGLAGWADHIGKELKMKNIKGLAEFKYCKLAEAFTELAKYEQ